MTLRFHNKETKLVLLCLIVKVEGLMRLMEGEHVGPFNLGNPGEFTMLELAKVCNDTLLNFHIGTVFRLH